MPGVTEHSRITKKRYGVSGENVHRWMDEPQKLFGSNHRTVRHGIEQEIPSIFVDEYGEELARNIMIDHILLDNDPNSIRKHNKKKTSINIDQDVWKDFQRFTINYKGSTKKISETLEEAIVAFIGKNNEG